MIGTMSLMTVVRLWRDPRCPAERGGCGHGLGAGPCGGRACRRRGGHGDFDDLLATGLSLPRLFLTRTWLAEPNVALIVPLRPAAAARPARPRALTALWVLPLAFTVFNASPLQLLWVLPRGHGARHGRRRPLQPGARRACRPGGRLAGRGLVGRGRLPARAAPGRGRRRPRRRPSRTGRCGRGARASRCETAALIDDGAAPAGAGPTPPPPAERPAALDEGRS